MQDAPDASQPRSLRNPANVVARRSMLTLPHAAPLAAYVQGLRAANPSWEFPDFDPLDGGIDAEMLFLFEKPGPRTSAAGGGSGFISRDNDDPSAEATFNFMQIAGIDRKRTVTWNVVPGWNGTRKITPAELREGVAALGPLLRLLPALRSVVLVGRRAQRAHGLLQQLGVQISLSAHPSPLVRASRPEAWHAIPTQWASASRHVDTTTASGVLGAASS